MCTAAQLNVKIHYYFNLILLVVFEDLRKIDLCLHISKGFPGYVSTQHA